MVQGGLHRVVAVSEHFCSVLGLLEDKGEVGTSDFVPCTWHWGPLSMLGDVELLPSFGPPRRYG